MSLVFLSACRVMSLEDFKWESNMINLGLIKVNLVYLWKRWWQGCKKGVGSKWGGGGVTWKALSSFNTLDCTLVNMPFLLQICHASCYLTEVRANTISYHMVHSVQWSLWWTFPWWYWQKYIFLLISMWWHSNEGVLVHHVTWHTKR